MKEELIVQKFENKNVRFIGEEKINLVDIAKCCGLTKKAPSGNEVIRWKGNETSVVEKMKAVAEFCHGERKEEIENILLEIDESEDRNTIFISQWLAKRLATECISETAMEFKNWLVSLDNFRENNNYVSINEFANLKKNIGELLVNNNEAISKALIMQTEAIQLEMNKLQNDIKSENTEERERLVESFKEDREKLKEFIGIRTLQVRQLSNQLRRKVENAYKSRIPCTDYRWKTNKENFLNGLGFSKWEDINIKEFSRIQQAIEDYDPIILITNSKNNEIIKDNQTSKENNHLYSNAKEADNNSLAHIKQIGEEIYQKCSCCEQWKPMNNDYYYETKKGSGTYIRRCKECKKNYYVANRDKRLDYQNNYTHENGIAVLRYDIKYNSKYSK